MNRDLLEKALNKTNEMEGEEKKKMRLAEKAGMALGVVVVIAADATYVWLVVKFLIGVSSFSWLSALGVMLLENLAYGKFRK